MNWIGRATNALPHLSIPIPLRHAPNNICYPYLDKELGIVMGRREPDVVNWFIDFVDEDTILFDVGAHIGFYSVLAFAHDAKGGLVIEPNPDNVHRALRALNRNGMRESFSLCSTAIGEKEGPIGFTPGFHVDMKTIGEAQLGAIIVGTSTLDSLVDLSGMHPTLCKVDVEGSADAVLQGGTSILTNDATWLIELHDESEREAVFRTLSNFDISWRSISERHIVTT